jgi:hypothetical protein
MGLVLIDRSGWWVMDLVMIDGSWSDCWVKVMGLGLVDGSGSGWRVWVWLMGLVLINGSGSGWWFWVWFMGLDDGSSTLILVCPLLDAAGPPQEDPCSPVMITPNRIPNKQKTDQMRQKRFGNRIPNTHKKDRMRREWFVNNVGEESGVREEGLPLRALEGSEICSSTAVSSASSQLEYCKQPSCEHGVSSEIYVFLG